MKFLPFAFLSLAILAPPAMASEISYDYIDIAYTDTKGNFLYDSKKYFFSSSFSLGNHFYGVVNHRIHSLELIQPIACTAVVGANCPSDSELIEYGMGLGYSHSVAPRVDFFIDASYFVAERSDMFLIQNQSEKAHTNFLRAGIRAILNERLEGVAEISHRDSKWLDNGNALKLGILIKVSEHFGMIGTVEDVGDKNELGFGFRTSF